jgi:hypothetical protein
MQWDQVLDLVEDDRYNVLFFAMDKRTFPKQNTMFGLGFLPSPLSISDVGIDANGGRFSVRVEGTDTLSEFQNSVSQITKIPIGAMRLRYGFQDKMWEQVLDTLKGQQKVYVNVTEKRP